MQYLLGCILSLRIMQAICSIRCAGCEQANQKETAAAHSRSGRVIFTPIKGSRPAVDDDKCPRRDCYLHGTVGAAAKVATESLSHRWICRMCRCIDGAPDREMIRKWTENEKLHGTRTGPPYSTSRLNKSTSTGWIEKKRGTEQKKKVDWDRRLQDDRRVWKWPAGVILCDPLGRFLILSSNWIFLLFLCSSLSRFGRFFRASSDDFISSF